MADTQQYEQRLGLWLEALESEEFEQGHRCLRGPGDHYCCLGVACEIYRRETGLGEWKRDRESYRFIPRPGQAACAESLPADVRSWFGIENSYGDLYWDRDILTPEPAIVVELRGQEEEWETSAFSLAILNDGEPDHGAPGLDFKQIAAVLRSRPRGLFTWT